MIVLISQALAFLPCIVQTPCYDPQTAEAFPPLAVTATTKMFQQRSGGLVHDVFTNDGLEVWTVEDGRIRHSSSGDFETAGQWEFQDTPTSAQVQLRRVHFLDNNDDGWAVGDNGVVLYTDDGGDNWQHIHTMRAPGHAQYPEILYDVYFKNVNEGWVLGLWDIWKTEDGGVNWCPVVLLRRDGSTPVWWGELEFYALDFIFRPNPSSETDDMIGLVCADHGVILSTHDGCTWTVEFDGYDSYYSEDLSGCGATGAFEFWDIELVDDGTSAPADATALAVGGALHSCGAVLARNPAASAPSRWAREQHECHYATSDPCTPTQGTSTGFDGSLYGVTTYPDGTALLCGYGGQMARRVFDQTLQTWMWLEQSDPAVVSPGSGPCLAYRNTVPMLGCDAADTNQTPAFVSGFFGTIRASSSGAAPFTSLPFTGPFRIQDVCGRPGDVVWSVGQNERIAKSSNGGRCFDATMHTPGTNKAANLYSIAFTTVGLRGVAVGTVPLPSGNFPRILMTTDSGATWTAVSETAFPAGAGQKLFEVDFAGQSQFFAAGTGGLVLRIDAQGTLHDESVSETTAKIHGISMATPTLGFAVGEYNGAAAAWMYSPSSNPPWVSLTANLPSGIKVLMDVAIDGGDAYAVGLDESTSQEGIVLRFDRTTGACTTESLPDTPTYVVLDALDDMASHTYQPFTIGSGTILNEVEISPDGDVFVAGDGGRLYHLPVGVTDPPWEALGSNTSSHIYGMSFASDGTAFMVGCYRTGSTVLGMDAPE